MNDIDTTLEMSEEEFSEFVNRYKPILANPYWIYDEKTKKQYYDYNNALKTGNTFTFNNDDKVGFNVDDFVFDISNGIVVSIIKSAISYGLNRLSDYADDNYSKKIVCYYILATKCLEWKLELMDVIDVVALDLLGMSALRYSKKAEKNINITMFESIKSLFGNDHASYKYIDRQERYINDKVKTRMLAFFANVSIVHNISNNEKFDLIVKKYTGNINEIFLAPSRYVDVKKLITSFSNQEYFVSKIKKTYDILSSDIGCDIYA